MPTCQGQHPDGSPCRNRTPAGETHCYIHRRLRPWDRLSRADVLEAIAEHVSIGGLDLSHEDLSSVDLNGVKLGSADLRGANLYGANLQGADLVWANLQGANVGRTNLKQADLGVSRLEKVDLSEVQNLTGVRWYGAFLEKTRLRREQLGEKIGDELTAERGEGTYDFAREAYLALKTNFNELGRYDDASWAYRRERRMERAMSWPGRAAREYKGEKERLERDHPWLGRPWFNIKHSLKWLWDGAVELVTDYGESPGWVLGWAALLLLVAYPFIYWWCAGRPAPAGNLLAFVKDYLLLSLGAFSTLDLVDLSAARFSNWTRLWAATEAMAGISLLALLMFTLGNRISRS